MIETSSKYKQAIKADSEEDVFKADFEFIPEGAIEGANVSTSYSQAGVSRLEQINNGVNSMSAKWMTCEPDRVVLDGTFDIIDTSNTSQQIGYFSENISEEDGTIEGGFRYTLDNAYDLIGVSIFFDDQCNEYATEGILNYYDSNNTLLKTVNWTNNSDVALIDATQTGVKYIDVIITKWNKGYRHIKVSGFLPGQKFIFDNENTFEFSLKEIISPFETSITMPQFSIEFDNSEKKFDMINPQGLFSYLRKKMKVNAKLGIKVDGIFEYVNCGKFFLYEFPADTQSEKALFICKPSMAFENGYYSNAGRGTQTVEQACAIIMEGESYTIDNSLKSIVVNQYIGEEVTKLNAMGQLAVACGGYWKITRDGEYQLKAWVVPSKTNDIDYDNMWSKPKIDQNKLITSVNCKYYTYNKTYKNLEAVENIVKASEDIGSQIEINSCFIPNKERADIIGNLILQYYNNYRLNHQVEYRGDMSIEAGDSVGVSNDYGVSNVMILSNAINYDVSKKISGSIEGIS